MKIDPDNYDLRELRRIADERRTDRDVDDDADGRRSREDHDRRRADDAPRREGGRSRDDARRSHDDTRRDRDDTREDRSGGGRDRDDYRRERGRRDHGGRSRDEGELRRPRPRSGDHAGAHDEVVRADHIARRFGIGDDDRDGGVRDRGRYDDLGYERSYDRYDDYDEVGEFRFDNPVHERPRGRAGEALRHNQLEQLLIHETSAAGGSLEKPYLSEIPKEYAAERVVFDWLEFLVLKGGFKRTMDALRYYYSVEWITEGVETELHDYLIGFSGNVSDTAEFDVDDHHLSLVYIAQLTSMADGVRAARGNESPRP